MRVFRHHRAKASALLPQKHDTPTPAPSPPSPPQPQQHQQNNNSLSSLILLRAPPAFSALWILVKPFIDPVTANKVRFVGSLPQMRRLAARLMVGSACAEAAEQAERHREAAARRRRDREKQRRQKEKKGSKGQEGGEQQQEEEDGDPLPPDLAAAAKEVEAALAALPAAVVGEGFGMPDAVVPPIEHVTARLLAAGRLPRSYVEEQEAEEEARRKAAAEAAEAAAAAAGADDAPPPPTTTTTVSALKSRFMASSLMQRLKTSGWRS